MNLHRNGSVLIHVDQYILEHYKQFPLYLLYVDHQYTNNENTKILYLLEKQTSSRPVFTL